jgi:hypothetical protein
MSVHQCKTQNITHIENERQNKNSVKIGLENYIYYFAHGC